MKFVDTHCHLDFNRFDDDRDAVVARAAAAGVTRIVVPALDLTNCHTVLDLTDRYAGVFAAVGVHPNSSAEWQPTDIDAIRTLAQHPHVVAIGEIGVDYYWDKSPKATQHAAFAAQLALAAELDLPVIIHNREAGDDTVALMAASPLARRARAGVMHSFSADAAIAKRALDLGFYLGFTGPLTFKKADDLRAVARLVPLDRVLIETDAPFLAPHPYRGKRNEPAYVVEVAKQLAALHDVSLDRIADITTANAERLFRLNAVNRS